MLTMWVDSGKLYLLDLCRNPSWYQDLFMGVYTFPVLWAHDTNMGDLIEPASSSYARAGITLWHTPVLDGSFVGQLTAPGVLLDNAGGTSYVALGWFIVTRDGLRLLCGDDFTAPEHVEGADGLLAVEPRLTSGAL